MTSIRTCNSKSSMLKKESESIKEIAKHNIALKINKRYAIDLQSLYQGECNRHIIDGGFCLVFK